MDENLPFIEEDGNIGVNNTVFVWNKMKERVFILYLALVIFAIGLGIGLEPIIRQGEIAGKKYDINIRVLVICYCVPSLIELGLESLNLRMNGWGSATGKFWCDLRVMLMEGYNAIYTVCFALSSSMLLWIVTLNIGILELYGLLWIISSQAVLGYCTHSLQFIHRNRQLTPLTCEKKTNQEMYNYQYKHNRTHGKTPKWEIFVFSMLHSLIFLITMCVYISSTNNYIVLLSILTLAYTQIFNHLCVWLYMQSHIVYIQMESIRDIVGVVVTGFMVFFINICI